MQEVSTNSAYHDYIDAVEAEMHRIGTDEFEVTDLFCGGVYFRTVFIPAGSYLTSKIHRVEHTFILLEGCMTIFTEDGGEEHLMAPYMGISKVGTRRFARAETDCRWMVVHRTDKQTSEEVEEEVIEKRINPLLINQKEELPCLGSQLV